MRTTTTHPRRLGSPSLCGSIRAHAAQVLDGHRAARPFQSRPGDHPLQAGATDSAFVAEPEGVPAPGRGSARQVRAHGTRRDFLGAVRAGVVAPSMFWLRPSVVLGRQSKIH
jgi:hypothetical protein